MKTYLLLIALALTGCGAEDKAQATSNQTAAPTATAMTTITSIGEEGRPIDLSEEAANRWVSGASVVTWYQAVEQAPHGCHLPARWELTKAFDDGDFKRVNTTVWTASTIDENNVWRVLMSNLLLYYPEHRSNMVDKRNKDHVIYKCEE